jgi:uncharacterized protein
MYNNVVEAIVEAFAVKKFTTLRFNFRGVGQSTGAYDEGRGEAWDILAAQRYLVDCGFLKIYFVGYSFGAWVGNKVLNQNTRMFTKAIFISPPNKLFDFTELTVNLALIVCGNQDNFCDVSVVKKQIENTKVKLEIVSDADHFYLGKEEKLKSILIRNISKNT